MILPFMKMFSRPVISGWKPVPTSRSEAMRPLMPMRPTVGEVTRERIFSSVLFPAPFLPMIPTTSPCSTLKSMSLRTHTNPEVPRCVRSLVSPILR